jgi:hypothetical protein
VFRNIVAVATIPLRPAVTASLEWSPSRFIPQDSTKETRLRAA